MQTTPYAQPITPISTVSSLGTNNIVNAATSVQSGPYTKAQFQNTMEGSRSVKNTKEIEQLLRDYPAALELYRTGRYKVKLKNEADIERVILVEKRIKQAALNNATKTNDSQPNNSSIPDLLNQQVDKKKEDLKEDRSRSRTHSRDHTAPTTSISDDNAIVQTTTSSIRLPSNAQPKVDHYRTSSKECDVSIISQPKQQQQQQQQQTHGRSDSHDSHSKLSHSKHKGKKHSRDYQNVLVPYVPNVNPAATMWQQSRAVQPYYSHPILPHQPPMPNMYMPSPYVSQQYPGYQQPYYYGQQPYPALVYQKPSTYPTTSTIKSTGTGTSKTHSGTHKPTSGTHPRYNNPNQGVPLAPAFHTFHPNQQPYSHPQAMYHSQLPFQMPVGWPTTATGPAGSIVNNNNNDAYGDSRRGSKNRARSVDTGPRTHQPVHYYNPLAPPPPPQQQPIPMVTEHHHHHHRHHHHRSNLTNVQVNNNVPTVEVGKDQNPSLRPITITAPNNGTNGEKLTIRQLNEIFLRTNPSGRLPYSSLPNILQRFGIALTENDLTTAAQNLDYNPNEPLSARRVVHILVDLGKIAKSTQQQQQQQQQQHQQQQQQQRPPASPVILPEDREVNDIMTQRRVAGAVSTHIHSSAYPNHWY